MFDWVAIYKDGSTHPHTKDYDIAQVDLNQVDKFQIKDVGSDVPLLQVHFDDPRKRLIYVRRTELMSTLPHPFICHLVGWQMKIGNENIQNVNYVFETIIVSWKGKPEKSEKIERHIHWIESAGKFDRNRDNRFYEPTAKQLSIIGSKAT